MLGLLGLTERFEANLPADIKNATVLCALSGGIDSMVLIHLLKKNAQKYSITIIAVHLNHGIRAEEAQRDQDFAQAWCADHQIEFIAECVDIPYVAKIQKKSIEQAARDERYKLFYRIAAQRQAKFIALGHHMNDHAETILLNLARGTGLAGLCGMQKQAGMLIRPMLDLKKAEIVEYAKENSIQFCIDSTNSSDHYARNRVRRLIPEFEKINAGFVQNLMRMSQNLRSENEALDSIANQILADNVKDSALIKDPEKEMEFTVAAQTLCIAEIKGQPKAIRAHIYRLYCKENGLISDLESRHIDLIDGICQSGGAVQLPNQFIATNKNGFLLIKKTTVPQRRIEDYCIMFHTQGETNTPAGVFYAEKIMNPQQYGKGLPNTVELNLDIMEDLQGQCTIRNRWPGDQFRLLGAPGAKKLKDYYIDKKIPAQHRLGPLLACDSEILWVVGWAISERVKVNHKDEEVLQIRFVAREAIQNDKAFL